MSKLDILVPHYHEGREIARSLLESIAIQQGIDFSDIRVIIADDGYDVPLDNEWLSTFPYEIMYLPCEHRGVSATRNSALDKSDAELVMFCDIDDMFYSVLGLWSIFKIYEKKPFDVFVPVFVEEQYHDGKATYIDHQPSDAVFVHGKVFRREYLVEKGLRFNPALTIHEDSYFIKLALRSTENVFRSDASFYMWKWRAGSVCRSDPKYLLKTFTNLMATQSALVEEYQKRGYEDVCELVVSCCYMVYYTLCQGEWMDPANKKFRDIAERCFREYFRRYGQLGKGIDAKKQMEISQNHRASSIQRGMIQEPMSFGTWIRKMS